MWTEHDPIAGRYAVHNMTPAEARELCTTIANARHYAKLLKRELSPAMDQLQQRLQVLLYGCDNDAPPIARGMNEPLTTPFR